jgi:hypothetical protein
MNRFKGLYCSPQGPDAFEILSAILEMRHVDEKTHELSTGHVHALHLFKNKFFAYTVGSRFATVRFTTIHTHDPRRVGLSTPNLWFVTVATEAPFLYLLRF